MSRWGINYIHEDHGIWYVESVDDGWEVAKLDDINVAWEIVRCHNEAIEHIEKEAK